MLGHRSRVLGVFALTGCGVAIGCGGDDGGSNTAAGGNAGGTSSATGGAAGTTVGTGGTAGTAGTGGTAGTAGTGGTAGAAGTGGNGTHPFPFSFDDPQFFANVSPSAPFSLDCTTQADRSVTEPQEPAAIVNNCGAGTSTLTRVRLGGDGGTNGNVREGYRCGGSGTMNIAESWLEAKGEGADHADVIQCYDPNNSPTAVMNLNRTTIRAYSTSATAGAFIADDYSLELHVDSVMFWGGPYGLRFHTDGHPGFLYMNDVCFYGEGDQNHSFSSGPFLMNPFPPTIVEWNNVNWCTIENGQLVIHGAIPQP